MSDNTCTIFDGIEGIDCDRPALEEEGICEYHLPETGEPDDSSQNKEESDQ